MKITNYKLKITKGQKTLFLVLVLVVIFSSANFASASWKWGDQIIPKCSISNYDPIGGTVGPIKNPCTECDLLILVQNLIDFVTLGVVPVVGTLLFIVGGFFILLGGASPGMVQRGKSIMWSTTMGIVIVLTAWLITNTLITSLIGNGAISGFNPKNWSTVTCPLP